MSWVVRVIESWRAGRRDDELMILTLLTAPASAGAPYLLRAQYASSKVRDAEPILTCASEASARRLVEQLLPDLVPMAPHPSDGPTIVMTWF